MKMSRFTDTQIVAVLQEAVIEEMAARDVCSRRRVSEQA